MGMLLSQLRFQFLHALFKLSNTVLKLFINSPHNPHLTRFPVKCHLLSSCLSYFYAGGYTSPKAYTASAILSTLSYTYTPAGFLLLGRAYSLVAE